MFEKWREVSLNSCNNNYCCVIVIEQPCNILTLFHMFNSIGPARRCQISATTPISVIRHWSDAPTATLVGHSKSGEVQDRPTCLQVPPRARSPVPLRLLRPAASIVYPFLPALSPVPGASSRCPSNENEDNRPSRLLPRFPHCLELAPRWFAWSCTLHRLF